MSNQEREADFFEWVALAFVWGWVGTVIVLVVAAILSIWMHGVLGLEHGYSEPRQAKLEAQTRVALWSEMHSCIQDRAVIKRFDYSQDRVDLYCETRKVEANEMLTKLISEGVTLKKHHAEGFAIHSGWQVLAGLTWLAWILVSPILMLFGALFAAILAVNGWNQTEDNSKTFVIVLCVAFPPLATLALYIALETLAPGTWNNEIKRVFISAAAIFSVLAYVASRKNAKKIEEQVEEYNAKVEAMEADRAKQTRSNKGGRVTHSQP
ncbi:hypothetical protein B0E33_30795 (plasmid) [Roseibium algicola]|jgi:outer membrane murein-binding lipoprotein Lpp|uniref:Uncharacterized protein n=1 Tax=Roseibium algicola TaxID=2857014 RepID=A0ABM6ICB4_9HYPH|nr:MULTISPECIES: hypothetical protein [Stappiaceae]AMN56328.1 hypothetical protein ACP90_27335 [Labrenzia sp. CP4]AQQ08205.1 hypothetical protein B0E33_30795 [Roseibium aggregatum]